MAQMLILTESCYYVAHTILFSYARLDTYANRKLDAINNNQT